MGLAASVAAAVLISGANYADYSSSRAAIARGGVEQNVFAGQQGQRLPLTKSIEVGVEVGIFELLKKQNKASAWAWVGVVVAGNAYFAHHNNQVLR